MVIWFAAMRSEFKSLNALARLVYWTHGMGSHIGALEQARQKLGGTLHLGSLAGPRVLEGTHRGFRYQIWDHLSMVPYYAPMSIRGIMQVRVEARLPQFALVPPGPLQSDLRKGSASQNSPEYPVSKWLSIETVDTKGRRWLGKWNQATVDAEAVETTDYIVGQAETLDLGYGVVAQGEDALNFTSGFEYDPHRSSAELIGILTVLADVAESYQKHDKAARGSS